MSLDYSLIILIYFIKLSPKPIINTHNPNNLTILKKNKINSSSASIILKENYTLGCCLSF